MKLISGRDTLSKIINSRQLTTLLQPIINLNTGYPIGYESLIRGPVGELFSPSSLFKCAKRNGLLNSLEKVCLEKGLAALRHVTSDKKIFININPILMAEMTKKVFLEYFEKVEPYRIVFEITEHVRVKNFKIVSDTCKALKEHGFLIAVDDMGSGYDRLRSVAELKPDFIKIDRPIVSGAVVDKQYRAIVKHLVALGNEIKCSVIAEGIETAYELTVMKALGVPLGQGFFFCKPVQLHEIPSGVDILCQVKGL